MLEGELLGGRYFLERLAGEGGMGAVYRALDRANGDAVVALKLMHRMGGADLERFRREAAVLRSIEHPGVLRFLDEGSTEKGDHYHVTEWLDGEDLQERLARKGLSIAETMQLAAGVADALAAVHAHGIVHRDLKPSNLFLQNNDVARVKVLDFGLARAGTDTKAITQTGVLLGTPGYMAPEQARGDRVLDGRSDLFSLGCVLFECLAGSPPFQGEHMLAVLARILLEEPPLVSSLRAQVPPELEQLIAQLLAKEPAQRPSDAQTVRRLIDVMEVPHDESAGPASPRREALTGNERRVVCIVLAAATPRETHPPAQQFAKVVSVMEPLQVRVERLRDGPLLLLNTSTGAPTELAEKAAHCALRLRTCLPEVPIALATGQADLARQGLMGAVLDRAVLLALTATRGVVVVDDVSAALLEPSFVLERSGGSVRLSGTRSNEEGTRTLLGRTMPCVGRDRELTMLQGFLDEVAQESVARCVLVLAPAGTGKTRLRQEFLERLRRSGTELSMLYARGDSLRAGSPFALVAQALRRTCELAENEEDARAIAKLRERLARTMSGEKLEHAVAFLGALLELRSEQPPSEAMRAAQRDPLLMGEAMRTAWEAWLHEETAQHPVLLLFEDLHWGDVPSVKFVDAALRSLSERPLFVLAFARPEVLTEFPSLWSERSPQQLRLDGLTKRAAEKLVQTALGTVATPALATLLCERAQGNAFFLEELIRAVASSGPDAARSLPDTVLGTLQARLDSLSNEARRVLRAASVYGERCTEPAVASLLEGARSASSMDLYWNELVSREVLVRVSSQEYQFRHALVRDAAYAMLTERDRVVGHRLAGQWLEASGTHDALLLAEHFSLGSVPERAAHFFSRAAEQALEGNDLAAVVLHVQRGIDCEVQALHATHPPSNDAMPTRVEHAPSRRTTESEEFPLPLLSAAGKQRYGALRLLLSIAEYWRANYAEAANAGEEASVLLHEGSASWFRAVAETIVASARAGRNERVEHWVSRVLAASAQGDASSAQAVCLARAAIQMLFTGRKQQAGELYALLEQQTGDGSQLDAVAMAQSIHARCVRAGHAGNHAEFRLFLTQALQWFERGGDTRNVCLEQPTLGWVIAELGDFETAESSLRTSLAMAERMGVQQAITFAEHLLGNVLAFRGSYDEAKLREERAVKACRAQGNRRLEGWSQIHLATIAHFAKRHEESEQAARTAVELLSVSPGLQVYARACVVRALLSQERIAEAVEEVVVIERALAGISSMLEGESVVYLMLAEAWKAAEKPEEAKSAADRARKRLLERSQAIANQEWRTSFLARPENVQTLALAERLCGG